MLAQNTSRKPPRSDVNNIATRIKTKNTTVLCYATLHIELIFIVLQSYSPVRIP